MSKIEKGRVVAKNVKSIDAIEPEAKRTNWRIKSESNLVIAVHPTNNRTWYVRYQIGAGKNRMQRWYEIGGANNLADKTANHVSLESACSECRKVMGRAEAGEDPAAGAQALRKADTFEALTEQWIAFKRRQGRADSYTTRSKYRLTLLPEWFRRKKAAEIKRLDVTAVLEEAASRGAMTETNRTQALISAVFKWAVSEGLLENDPSQGVKRRFEEAPRERVLTDAEVKAIWTGLNDARGSEASKIAIKLVFVLGQRPNEIVQLRQDKLALDALHPTATIERATSKNRTEHVVPLPRLAVELLRRAVEITAGSQWVFPNPEGDGPIEPHALSVVVFRARDMKDANGKLLDKKERTLFGVKDAQLYDAKKTIATFLGNAGHPDQFIGLLFNHLTAKSGTVTGKHYNHATYMKTKRELVEEWAWHLEGVLGIERDVTSAVADLAEYRSRA